jgi:hypothetical protein
MLLNKNFRDMLLALNDEGAEYLVVGAYAVGTYLPPRATGDFDIWVRPTRENAERVWRALIRFGAPQRGLTIEDLATPDIVFHFGLPPQRIDILTSITGVEFEEGWAGRTSASFDGVPVSILGRVELLKNKRSTGRPKDTLDADDLERLQS